MKPFPKIFAVDSQYVDTIFQDEVEITEKIDGSYFCFGKDIEGNLRMRSKGKEIYIDAHDNLFNKAVDTAQINYKLLDEGEYVHCEYLKKPKHNALIYKRVPNDYLIVFGVSDEGGVFQTYDEVVSTAWSLGLEAVPLYHQGKIERHQLEKLLEKESCLGGNIEGLVIKNHHQLFLIGGQPMPLMCGKLVTDEFKEVHRTSWTSGADTFNEFIQSFRTEARWDKAIQHLREVGELTNTPQDIGKLITEIKRDIIDEEGETIKSFLFKHFIGRLIGKATGGFPEHYKLLIEKDGLS